MVIRIGKPDSDDENQRDLRKGSKFFRPILVYMLVILLILGLLAFLAVNLPGRYKAIVVSEGAPDEVLVLDTVKGNTWRYQCTKDVTVMTYMGKLRVGEKIPERIVIKLRND